MRADAVSEALWPKLSEFIAENTGLHFPPERRSDLERGLTGAAAEFGLPDAAACADWLLSTPLTKPQLNVLASHLTVGETYFFREPRTFDAFATHILPELIQRRRGREQRLRLWSAACATGEEAYSLAILLKELLPDWREWSVSILATDINHRFLQKAAAGAYGQWSFRESPPPPVCADFRERYFIQTAEGRFAVVPEIKAWVKFAHMNLAQDGFPSLATETNAMDVIFCRNMLIYFTVPQMQRLIVKLRQSLVDDGWLAVAPSECSQTFFSRFATVNFPGAILYRRSAVAEPARTPSVFTTHAPPFSPADWADSPKHGGPAPEWIASPANKPEPAARPAPAPDPAARARALANEGKLGESLVWSERWIAADKLNPAAHYLHAMIRQELGEFEPAQRSLMHTIYLDPTFALAHFALGNLARGEARGAQANKHFDNALHVLRALPAGEPLPESDGLTAGRLTEIIAALTSLSAQGPAAQGASANDIGR